MFSKNSHQLADIGKITPDIVAQAQSTGDRHVISLPYADVDWALSPVPADFVNKQFCEPRHDASLEDLIIKTPSGVKTGTLTSTGVLWVPTMKAPQRVLVASVDNLRHGDSGSWSMLSATGSFNGMLIGSCPTLGESYLLRMEDILDDIQHKTELEVTVATTLLSVAKTDPESPSHQASDPLPPLRSSFSASEIMSDLDNEEPRFVTDDIHVKLMACPYYLLDSERYDHCLGRFSLRRFSDVKQHLQRFHTMALHDIQITPELPGLPLSSDSDNLSQNKIVADLDTISRYPGEKEWASTDKLFGETGSTQSLAHSRSQHSSDKVETLRDSPLSHIRTIEGSSDEKKWFAIWDMLFGGTRRPNSPWIMDPANELYSFLQKRGQALPGNEKTWDPENTSMLPVINNLANLYKAQSKLDSAEEMYQRALQGFKQAYGPDHTLTLSTVNNLANVYKSQGKVENASMMSSTSWIREDIWF
jgi:hypothetical protein